MRLDGKDRFEEANHIRAFEHAATPNELTDHIVDEHDVIGFGTSDENLKRLHVEVHLRDAARQARALLGRA